MQVSQLNGVQTWLVVFDSSWGKMVEDMFKCALFVGRVFVASSYEEVCDLG